MSGTACAEAHAAVRVYVDEDEEGGRRWEETVARGYLVKGLVFLTQEYEYHTVSHQKSLDHS